MPRTVVPNSGYAGGDSQWDHQTLIRESPTYQEPEGCIGGGCRDSTFTALASTTQGVALMSRGQARGVLSTDLFPVLNQLSGLPVIGPDGLPELRRRPAFSASDLQFQMAPGYDEIVERYLGRDVNNYDWYVQGAFRGLNDWVCRATIDSGERVTNVTQVDLIPPNGATITQITHGGLNSFFGGVNSEPASRPPLTDVTLPPPFVGLDWADRHTFHYDSEFNSAELNVVLRPHPRSDRIVLYPNGEWHREVQPGAYWSFLAGFRYFNVDENFTFRGAGSYEKDVITEIGGVETGRVSTSGLLSGTYFAHTHNELFGLQLGSELTLRNKGWEVGFHFKVSPMLNTAVADAVVDTTDPIFGNQHAAYHFVHTRVAAILDLGVLTTYRLSEAWAIRAGYDISWLTGVAFAPTQNPLTNQVIEHSTVFVQGLILGMEYRR